MKKKTTRNEILRLLIVAAATTLVLGCKFSTFGKSTAARSPSGEITAPSSENGEDPVAFAPDEPITGIAEDGSWLYPTPTPTVEPPPPPVANFSYSGVGQ